MLEKENTSKRKPHPSSTNNSTMQIPAYVSRPNMAKILGVSVDMFRQDIEPFLYEELHWVRFKPNGQKRFFVAEVLKKYKPARSELVGLTTVTVTSSPERSN